MLIDYIDPVKSENKMFYEAYNADMNTELYCCNMNLIIPAMVWWELCLIIIFDRPVYWLGLSSLIC